MSPSVIVARRTAAALAAPLLVLTALMWAVPAPAPAAAPADDQQMMLVFDSSGSMKEPAAGGVTKIKAAKQALNTLVGNLPDDAAVGLRVYGATVFSRQDPGACTDSQRVVDIGTDNRDDLTDAVAKYKPYGETPIGYSLEQAADDLGPDGQRTIVLVSDGNSTCQPDPCKVAAKLAKDGIKLRIDVIGLDVNTAARDQLSCIAEKGNGTYYDATNTQDLVEALDTLATRALRPYETTGQPIAGTPAPAGAPELAVGDWVDTLGPDGSPQATRYYALAEPGAGSTLHLSASLVDASGGPDTIEIALVPASDPDSSPCAQGKDFRVGRTGASVLTAGVTWVADEDASQQASCSGVETVVKVTRSDGGGSIPVELRVIEEPAVAGTDDLPAGFEEPAFQAPGKAQGTRVVGGSSFEGAPTLEPGRYSANIVPGEAQIFLVEVDWGQAPQAEARFAKPTGSLANLPGTLGAFATLDILAPSRASVRQSSPEASDGEGVNGSGYLTRSDAKSLRAIGYPVAYNNRGGSFAKGEDAASLAGTYAIVVSVEPEEKLPSYQLPYTLDIAVNGEVTGAPAYEEPVESAPPTDAPSATDPADDTDPDGDAGSAEASSEADEDSAALPLVLGGVGAASILGAALIFGRSRRRSG